MSYKILQLILKEIFFFLGRLHFFAFHHHRHRKSLTIHIALNNKNKKNTHTALRSMPSLGCFPPQTEKEGKEGKKTRAQRKKKTKRVLTTGRRRPLFGGTEPRLTPQLHSEVAITMTIITITMNTMNLMLKMVTSTTPAKTLRLVPTMIMWLKLSIAWAWHTCRFVDSFDLN